METVKVSVQVCEICGGSGRYETADATRESVFSEPCVCTIEDGENNE